MCSGPVLSHNELTERCVMCRRCVGPYVIVVAMDRTGDAFEGDNECAAFTTDDQQALKDSFIKCPVNPGHDQFLTVQEFKRRGHTICPEEDELTWVWNYINKTVRIKVNYTSPDRPETFHRSDVPYPLNSQVQSNRYRIRYGTGFLDFYRLCHDEDYNYVGANEPCPCPDCKRLRLSSRGQRGQATTATTTTKTTTKTTTRTRTPPVFSKYFRIITATHVVFDSKEAENTVIDFFYDSEDRKDVGVVYGVKVLERAEKRLNTDKCCLLCVTHDKILADKLTRLSKKDKFDVRSWTPRYLISHPHGLSKRISFGSVTHSSCFVYQKEVAPITLKKGLNVRVSGNRDISDIVNMLDLQSVDGGGDDDVGGGGDGDCGVGCSLGFSDRCRECIDSGSEFSGDSGVFIRSGDGSIDAGSCEGIDGNDHDGGCCSNSSCGGRSDNVVQNCAIGEILPDSPVSDLEIENEIFKTSCDVTIRSRGGFTIFTDIEGDVNSVSCSSLSKDKWWTLQPGTEFFVGDEQRFTLPIYAPGNNSNNNDSCGSRRRSVKFEFYIKGDVEHSLMIRNGLDPRAKVFRLRDRYWNYSYNMASCPGSSGAWFGQRSLSFYNRDKHAVTHFGCTGQHNRTGLTNEFVLSGY